MTVWVAITDSPVYIRGRGGGGRGGNGGGWGHKRGNIFFRSDVIRYTQKGGDRCARGATKCYKQKHKGQYRQNISKPVALLTQSIFFVLTERKEKKLFPIFLVGERENGAGTLHFD